MAEVTLKDVNTSLQEQNKDSEKRDRSLVEGITGMSKSLNKYFKTQEAEKRRAMGDRLEERRERNKPALATGPSVSSMFKDANKEGGFLATIGAILAAATGFIAGALRGIVDSVKFWFKGVTSLVNNSLTRGLTNITKFLTKGFFKITGVAGLVDLLFEPFRVGFQRIKDSFSKSKVASGINNVTTRIANISKGLSDLFQKAGTGKFLKQDTIKAFGKSIVFVQATFNKFASLAKMFRSVGDAVGSGVKLAGTAVKSMLVVPNFLRGITDSLKQGGAVLNQIFGSGKTAKQSSTFVKTLKAVFTPISGIFRAFGSLGRFLFGPVTVAIFSLIDGVMGAFKGFTETEGGILTKILGAVNGFASGIISGFVGGLLDLGKMIVGWVAGLFGFDDFKEQLAAFSFREMIFDGLMFPFRAMMSLFDGEEGNMFSDLGKTIYDNLMSILTDIKDWFVNRASSIGSNVAGFFGFGEDENSDVANTPTPMRGRNQRAQELAEQRDSLEEQRTASNAQVFIQDNSNNSTNTSGGGGGSTVITGAINGFDLSDPMFSTR